MRTCENQAGKIKTASPIKSAHPRIINIHYYGCVFCDAVYFACYCLKLTYLQLERAGKTVREKSHLDYARCATSAFCTQRTAPECACPRNPAATSCDHVTAAVFPPVADHHPLSRHTQRDSLAFASSFWNKYIICALTLNSTLSRVQTA